MESQPSTVVLQEFLAAPKNREAFAKFARKYHPRIKQRCLARGLQEADADEVTASILLRFCERDVFEGFVFQSKEKFYAWLRTVVTRAVLTFVRDRGRKPDAWSVGNRDVQESLEQVAERMSNEVQVLCQEDQARVEMARVQVQASVGEKTWQAFHLVVDEEQTVEAVTEHLQMSKVAVWQAVSRIKRKLREELSDLHELAREEK